MPIAFRSQLKCFVAFLCMACLSLLLLCSCSPTREQQAEAEAEAEACELLDAVVQQQADVLTPFWGKIGFSPSLYGISDEGFMKTYYANFSYEITGTSESDGVTAIDCTFNLPNFDETLVIMDAGYAEAYGLATTTETLDEAFAEGMAAQTPKQTAVTFTLLFTNNDDGTLTLKNESDLACALLAGYDPRQESSYTPL